LGFCSRGSLILQPMERPPASLAPRLAASMTGTAAGHDGKTGVNQLHADLARDLVIRMILTKTGGTEDGDAGPDEMECAKAAYEL
jgi:hypothetical protein